MAARTLVRMVGNWGEVLEQVTSSLRDLVDDAQRSTVGVATERLRADIAGLQEVICAVPAAQAVRLAHFVARDEERNANGVWVEVDRGVGNVAEFRADEVAPILALPPFTAQRRVDTAARLASVLSLTLRALAEGNVDPARAQIVGEGTRYACAATCAEVEELLHPVAHEETPGRLRRRVRRLLALVDPEAVKAGAARARNRLFVHVRACEVPGVSEWFAQLSTEDSLACWAAIDEAGHRSKAEDPSRGIDQCRAEALVDLILGRVEVTTQVSIAIPVHRFTPDGSVYPTPDDATGSAPTLGTIGATNAAAEPRRAGAAFLRYASGTEAPGIGIITGDVLDTLVDRFGVTLAGMLVDVETGVTLATASIAYRPPTRIREFVRLRDGTCRFPGCGVRTARCDLDHVTPWSPAEESGRTDPSNLISLCRHHHRMKTRARWKPTLDPVSAEVTWTDPYGQHWLTRPTDHLSAHVA